jgi:hypothetical protein
MKRRFFKNSVTTLGGLVLAGTLLFAACDSPTNVNKQEQEEEQEQEQEEEQEIVTVEYTITPTVSSNGRIIAAPEKAAEGTEVTLVLIPDVYYSLAAAPQVTLADGTAVPLTEKETAEPYTFAMPAADVTVSASFAMNAAHNDLPLYSAADLAKIGVDPAYPMNGVYQLEADFSVTDWMPIGEFPGKPFTGILRGNNHTITINSFSEKGLAKPAVGLFAYTAFAEMENLNIAANFNSGLVLTYDGTLMTAYGTVVGLSFNMNAKNITVEGAVDIAAPNSVEMNAGGIIGAIHSGKIENCIAEMEIASSNSTGDSNTGGIVGQIHNFGSLTYFDLSSGVLITECGFAGAVIAKSLDSSSAGGIVGLGSLDVIIQHCTIEDGISIEAERTQTKAGSSYTSAGGIAGQMSGMGSAGAVVNDCAVGKGLIKATGAAGTSGSTFILAGGIAGYLTYAGSISACVTAVDVEALFESSSSITNLDIMAGGIAGYNTRSAGTTWAWDITNCFASGDILAENKGAITGGNRVIAGGITGSNAGVISGCYATGSIEGLLSGTATSVNNRNDLVNAGGITAILTSSGASINDSYYAGDEVKATGDYATAGGIAAVAIGDVSIAKCYSLGNVSVKGTKNKTAPNGTDPMTTPYNDINVVKIDSAGGIVGHNQAGNATTIPKTENCVALNNAISSEGVKNELIFAGRIVGNNQGRGVSAGNYSSPGTSSIPENNWANSAMTITRILTGGSAGSAPALDEGATPENTLNGKDVSSPPDQAGYTELGWDFAAVWQMGATGYPVLAWQN